MNARNGIPITDQLFEKSMPVPFSGCWIWMGARINGSQNFRYGKTWNGKRNVLAHRASYEAFVGLIPDGLLVLHRCDVPECINPKHLFLGTYATNCEDKVKKGRQAKGKSHGSWARGEKNHNSKLTASDVLAIRSDGRSKREIAREYSVSVRSVFLIKSRERWGHL